MARNRNVTVIKLSDAVAEILEEYRDDMADMLDEAARKTANETVKNLKTESASKFGGTGRYAKSWTKKQTDKTRGQSAYTVYNKLPGLPHLLENGHAKVNGGTVDGVKHIAPIEEQAVESFQKRVQEGIKNA